MKYILYFIKIYYYIILIINNIYLKKGIMKVDKYLEIL